MPGAENSFGASQSQAGHGIRSSSPAVKRRMSELEGYSNHIMDVNMENGGDAHEQDSRPTQRRATSVDMIGSENNIETATDVQVNPAPDEPPALNIESLYPTPSSIPIYTVSTSTREESKVPHLTVTEDQGDVPPIDEQVATVVGLMAKPLADKQKGYVLSALWLNCVLARSSQPVRGIKIDKRAAEGEIGPVDNSDLLLITDPSIKFKDERGEPFVPLRPALQMGEDFEIVPQEAWDLIMKWYGLAEQSPLIIRYAHNTNATGAEENIQYEINPPVFTILKLANPASGITTQSLREKGLPPVKTLASRHTNFQKWLRHVKELVNIDIKTKVRVWRILGGLSSSTNSGVITPDASRSSSPAPGAQLIPSAGSSLNLDVSTFVSLADGSQRELLEDARDQTANEKYNGSMTLDLAGLSGNDVVVLEEQIGGPAGGEWVFDVSKQALNRLGIPAVNNKNLANKIKAKTAASTSGRSSPALEPIRGRRKDGKPRGNTGLSNLGNTCYMNSALQCVRSVEELTYYFLNDVYKQDLNPSNPLAHGGEVAKAYANFLHMVYDENGPSSFAPRQIKQTIGRYGPAFSGYGQQDSQEFLLFLLDGLQEDLNRIRKKPYIEKPDSTDDMVHNKEALKEFAQKNWEIYKARNDSVITDLFAGMYKSTLVCPACDKVSIIFDPFNSLTLQLPVENLWSKEIFYFALNRRPITVDVEIDKNSSIKALKEYVAKKTGSDAQRLVMAEVYKNKFYKMFDNISAIADANINAGDEIGIFELESVPTNYNPDKPKKSFSMLSFREMDTEEIPSIDSPKADRLLVPIFHRLRKSGSRYTPFGAPAFTIVTREEASDYDAILRKVLNQVATLTTRDILNDSDSESVQEESFDSDTVVMNDEDADSADSKIKTSSVDGEDGLVDVSMRDASDQADDSTKSGKAKNHSNVFIPPKLQTLFEMRIYRTNESIPLGYNSGDDGKNFPLILSRLEPKSDSKQAPPQKRMPIPLPEGATSPVSSDDELAAPVQLSNKTLPRVGDDSDEYDTPDGHRSITDLDSESDSLAGVGDMFHDSTEKSHNRSSKSEPADGPLLRPGEGIVVDWSEEMYDALFGGDHRDPYSLRGAPTWTSCEHLPDPELTKRREKRQGRKKRGITLHECLDEFGKEEILSENDAWYCPRCKEHRRASKKFELWKTPDILVMHLKRFSANRGFRDKLDVLVDFPIEELDLTDRVVANDGDEKLVYDLFAVDNHYGGLGGGHYTAYAKNFFTDEWNEYNDSHVSKPIDPQRAVTSAAYLLFYRRRSYQPLGGKILQDITESSVRELGDSESQIDSRAESPAGEGQRLGGSSRNGSSSALVGVGAVHQAGDGGLQPVTRVRSVGENDEEDDDLPPEYSNRLRSGERSLEHAEGMDLEDPEYISGIRPSPLRFANESMWSFDRASDTPELTQSTGVPRRSYYEEDEDDAFDDDDSNRAVGGDLSDSDARMPSLDDTSKYPHFTVMNPLTGDGPAASDEEDNNDLPVVELRVNEEEKEGFE